MKDLSVQIALDMRTIKYTCNSENSLFQHLLGRTDEVVQNNFMQELNLLQLIGFKKKSPQPKKSKSIIQELGIFRCG